jgi:hypothetical protein
VEKLVSRWARGRWFESSPRYNLSPMPAGALQNRVFNWFYLEAPRSGFYNSFITAMKITLENTDQIIQFNGVPARVWVGKTESGIEVEAFITRIAVHKDQDHTQFQKELSEQPVPRTDSEAWPYRMLL